MEKQRVIAFSGTHGVGKSVLAKSLADLLGYKCVDNIGRRFKFVKNPDLRQLCLVLSYLKNVRGSVVCSRSFFDLCVYARHFSSIGWLVKALKPFAPDYDVIFFVISQFKLKEDHPMFCYGEDFRYGIECEIFHYVKDFAFIVSGSLETRCRIISEVCNLPCGELSNKIKFYLK